MEKGKENMEKKGKQKAEAGKHELNQKCSFHSV
jgi:hypothetical protein